MPQCLRLVLVSPPPTASSPSPVPHLRLHRVLGRGSGVTVYEIGAVFPVLGIAAVPSTAATVAVAVATPSVGNRPPAHYVLNRDRLLFGTAAAAGDCARPVGGWCGHEGVLGVRVEQWSSLAPFACTLGPASPVSLPENQGEDSGDK